MYLKVTVPFLHSNTKSTNKNLLMKYVVMILSFIRQIKELHNFRYKKN